MKIKLLLIVILFGIIGPSKGQDGKRYYPSIGYEKFVGTYTFQDDHKDYILKLESKEKVYFELIGVYVDVLEGTIGYSEHGMSSKPEDSPQISFGFVDKENPNIVHATYLDKERHQTGRVTLEFNPQDSSIVFMRKKIPGGVMFNDDEGLKRSRRPFTIPEELKLKRKKD